MRCGSWLADIVESESLLHHVVGYRSQQAVKSCRIGSSNPVFQSLSKVSTSMAKQRDPCSPLTALLIVSSIVETLMEHWANIQVHYLARIAVPGSVTSVDKLVDKVPNGQKGRQQ